MESYDVIGGDDVGGVNGVENGGGCGGGGIDDDDDDDVVVKAVFPPFLFHSFIRVFPPLFVWFNNLINKFFVAIEWHKDLNETRGERLFSSSMIIIIIIIILLQLSHINVLWANITTTTNEREREREIYHGLNSRRCIKIFITLLLIINYFA